MLTKDYAAAHDVLASLAKTIQARAHAVGGETTLTVGRVHGLELGPFTIANPVTVLPEGEIAAPGKAGNIGGKLLRRFRVIFDYSRGRMILEPDAGLSDPDEYDMSGASLSAEAPGFATVRVTRVLESSPAAEAGLTPGDAIVSVDDEPAATLGLSRIRAMFAREGAEYELLVRRGERTLRARLKLRRLV
jgi:membrane-associated protease RseP (regulator of RpoE activity)